MNKKRWIGAAGVALVAVIAAVIVLVASSGGSDPASASADEQLAQFQNCLSDQGVEMPTPGAGVPGSNSGSSAAGSQPSAGAPAPPQIDEKTQAAMQACSQYAPTGGPGGPGGVPPTGTPPAGAPPTGALGADS